MTDPERLLDRPPSELARSLLRAGTEEAPSERSLRRTLSALGAGAAALGAASSAGALGATSAAGGLGAAKLATSATLVTLGKWAGIGAVGGMVVAAAAHGFDPPAKKPSAVPRAPVAVHAAPAPVAAEPLPLTTSEPPPAPPEPEPAPRRLEQAPAAPVDLEAPLAAEVAFVDRGRAAFQRGQSSAALSALAGYEREFSEPRLLPEVLYLRMEALEQRGDHTEASELGRRILRDYSRSPHAARARAIVFRK
jgi:hypothetical protein